jgi:Mrp family chromosome partitioning ATPase/capsular polysaccharide biosynthesis protein
MEQEPPSLPGRGIKPFDSLLNHTRLAIITFFVVFVLGFPVIFIKGVPKYQTTATIQVAPRYMKNLKDDQELEFQSNSQYRQFVEQQTKTINRYDIVETALNNMDKSAAEAQAALSAPSLPQGTPNEPKHEVAGNRDAAGSAATSSLKTPPQTETTDSDQGDLAAPPVQPKASSAAWQLKGEKRRRAVERLQGALKIFPVPDTYLVQITLESTKKEGLADVVNAVVGAYLISAKEEQVYGSAERVRQLKVREKEISDLSFSMTKQRSQIAQKLGLTAFISQNGNPFDKLSQKLREDIADARARRIDAEAKLAAYTKSGETDLVTRSILESVLLDPGLNSLKSTLNKRQADLVTITSGLSHDHPTYLAAQDEILEIDAEIAASTKKLTDQIREGLLKRYQTAVEQTRQVEQELTKALSDAEEESGTYAAQFNQAVTLTSDLEQLRKELESVRERLNFFAIETTSPGLVRPVTFALPPDLPQGTGKKTLLIIVFGAALVLSLLMPTVADMLDRRIRTFNDAYRALGFAPMGWLVEQVDAETMHFAQDQLRRLASALIREQDKHGTKTVAFTAVKPGAGTTKIVQSLSHCLNDMGVLTLCLEANAFKPSSTYGTGPGLQALLTDPESEPQIQDMDGVPSLPVGSSVMSRQLNNIDQLKAVLQRLETNYRFVLVDTPPLLTSSDSELIVRATNSVVVVVEADGLAQGELKRASQLLTKLDPASVGAVVNRIMPFQGGGYLESIISEHATGRKQAAPSSGQTAKRAFHALAWDAAALWFKMTWEIRSFFGRIFRRKK